MREQVERICISINTECNLGCKYCYFFNPENRVSKESVLSVDEIFTILKQINEYSKNNYVKKVIKVNFVGSGEPLINWDNIKEAINKFYKIKVNNKVEFYLVTNGTLLTDEIAREMKKLNIFPSVSLDGYEELHNENRVTHNGNGSFQKTMNGIEYLRKNNFKIAINTTVTKSLVKNLRKFFEFLKQQKIDKVIFDRLVDTPSNFEEMTYAEFYDFLLNAYKIKENLNSDIEIGNIEAYKKNFEGRPDKVCTMFGASCGAGINFLIYMSREVYPCGRMFGKKRWKLGNYQDDIEKLQNNMYSKMPNRQDCQECSLLKDCIRDCLLEYEEEDYSCLPRQEFLIKLKEELYK
jgi:uncharacterized protein